MPLNTGYLKTPSGILKLLETVLVVVAFGMFRGSDAEFKVPVVDISNGEIANHEDANYFGGGVLVTALIITPLLTTCYIMGRLEIQKTIFEIVFNFLMAIFLITAGFVSVTFYRDQFIHFDKKVKSQSMVMATFCILAGIAYLADTACAVYLYRQTDRQTNSQAGR